MFYVESPPKSYLVQSTTKVHHPQLFVRTKIFSSYSISVATSYSRSTQNL